MSGQDRRLEQRQLTEKELAMLRTHADRQDRYIRTALFVQSKWFLLIATAAIAAFMLLLFLV